MAQDLTTYIEVDPSADLTVTASSVTIDTLARNVDTFVYRDFSTNFFSANFTVFADFKITAGSIGIVPILAFTNTIDDLKAIRDALGDELHCTLYTDGTTVHQIYIGLSDSTGILVDSINVALNTMYYIKFYRDESVGTYGTLYLKLYTSAANRDSDTGATTRSLTLRSRIDFRYFMPIQSYNDAQPTNTLSGLVENVKLISPRVINALPLTGTFTLPDPTLPIYAGASPLTANFTVPATTIVSSIKVLPDPLTGTFTIPVHTAGIGVVAVDPLTATFTMPSVTVSLPCIITVSPLTGTFYVLDPYVVATQKSILFGAYNLPNSKTMSYKIVDDTEATIQDWTTTGVVETVVDATANKSIYTVRTNKVSENFQGKIMWKSSDATPLTAVEIINIYSSYVDILQNRLTAQRATKLDNLDSTITSRLLATDYTAPDNAGIAAIPLLSEIEGSSILAKEASVSALSGDITSILNYAIAMSKWKNNRMVKTGTVGSTETWVIYDDDNTTPLLTYTFNTSTKVRTKAT